MTPPNRRVGRPSIPAIPAGSAPGLATGSGPASGSASASATGAASASGSASATGAPRASVSTSAPSRFFAAVRTIFGVALVVACSVGVAWVARRHIMTSPRFAVTAVDVIGNERRTADAIASEGGIAVGANVFVLDLDAARARLLADPWIAEVALARRLPGTILVQITERKAAAIITMGDTFLATADGDPFKRLEPGDPIDLPVVTGIHADAYAADREGTMRTVRRAVDLAAEYERGWLAKRSPLQEVHVDSEGAFHLVVGRSGMQLVLGGPPFRRKLEQAARVVAELDKRGSKADAIMLDNDARPERVVVRMR
jgi:cell division protein FtsQ